MKVAIHQPEHFPYLGFFQKMKYADVFVILDDAQFSKGNWHNRNKFLNKNDTEEWFTVQLKKFNFGEKINKVYCDDDLRWRKKIINKINQNFNIDLTEIYNHKKLIDINMQGIYYCRKRLGIETKIIFSSDLEINDSYKSSEKLAKICSILKAKTYVSGEGGINYLDASYFECEIEYFKPDVKDYYTILSHL
ncbi:WbqC family protein [Flavobacteriaceae bacterium]|nr:WbqC family protein [Flavobacteriaceae bacterium]